MTDLSQTGTLSPIDRARLSGELLQIRNDLAAGTLSALEKARGSARAIQIRTLLGTSAAATSKSIALATGRQKQKNGSVIVTGDPVTLAAYAATHFDGLKVVQNADGIVLPKSKAGLAEFIPTEQRPLPSGAVVYEHGAMDGGASITYLGEMSGVARDLAQLKGIMAREWGGAKFREAFGEDASPEDVQAYQDEQDAVARRKAQSEANAVTAAALPEKKRQQDLEQAALAAAELEGVKAKQEAKTRAQFAESVGKGISGNVVYQAYLDTLETLPAFEAGNSGFLGWATMRAGEFERKTGARAAQRREEYEAFLREYAKAHLSDRVRTQRAQVQTVALTGNEFGEFPDTPEGKKALRAAAKAYLEGMRGQMVDCPALGEKVEIRQRGIKETIAFSGNPKKLRLLHAIPKIITSAKVASRSDNHKRDKKPDVVAYINLKSTVLLADEEITVEVVIEQDSNGHLYYDLMIDPPKEKAMLDSSNTALGSKRSPDHNSGHLLDSSVEQGHEGVTRDDAGGAQVLNLFVDEISQQQVGHNYPAGALTEYTTSKGKTLRGLVRKDLTMAQARGIDPHTWRINGGYFIREKYLVGGPTAAEPTS